jgi:hypothetical protein
MWRKMVVPGGLAELLTAIILKIFDQSMSLKYINVSFEYFFYHSGVLARLNQEKTPAEAEVFSW